VDHKRSVREEALALFGGLYEVERGTAALNAQRRRSIRQEKARPIANALHAWLTAQRQKVPPGSATTRAIDYTLGHGQR
jgi:transposase